VRKAITYVGLDVHKDWIVVSLAEAGLRGVRGEVREYGKIANTAVALERLARKLAAQGNQLRFCYEAGPCGYGIQRQLSGMGHECDVVAPSLIPRKPGERIKTDRRDANKLAKLHRAGELTRVWVPDQTHEAVRDLVRARHAAARELRRARQQLSSFLLRNGHTYPRTPWRPSHRRWLAGLKFDQPMHYLVLEDAIAAVEAAQERRHRLEAQIEAALPGWSLAPVVGALQALRGIALVGAVTLAAELGDITRFDNPRQLMAYIGLVPSEHSSGRTRRQGGITKAGNTTARRMLIEAAWSYHCSARISREQLLKQEALLKPIRDIAWKAQDRLCRRYRTLARSGKLSTVICTAIARELTGFVWAIAHEVGRSASRKSVGKLAVRSVAVS
jgi:transposase